jgi:hypothetical protein
MIRVTMTPSKSQKVGRLATVANRHAREPAGDLSEQHQPESPRGQAGELEGGRRSELDSSDDDVEDQEDGQRTGGTAGEVDQQEHGGVVGQHLEHGQRAVEPRLALQARAVAAEHPGEDRVVERAGDGDGDDRDDRELETQRLSDQQPDDHQRRHTPAQLDLPEAAPAPELRQAVLDGRARLRAVEGGGPGRRGMLGSRHRTSLECTLGWFGTPHACRGRRAMA